MKNRLLNPSKLLAHRLVWVLLVVTGLWGCNEPSIIETTTTDVNINGYLELNKSEFSLFQEILERSGNSGFLGAYGAYTVFVPTNEAVTSYLKDKGKASVQDFEVEELRKLVRFHVLADTLTTPAFTDGKIAKPTMYGQYLTTGAANTGGVTRYRINRQANIIQSNISLGNGIVHVIDKVLEPAALTLAQMVEQDPKYSIFARALKETGLYNTLNILPENATSDSLRWFTLIAESNETLAKKQITSYEQLKAEYSDSNVGDPKNPQDSLYLYVAYHILPDIKYVADIVTSASHATLAPLEVITTRVEGETVLINADIINGVQEVGSAFDRTNSDYSATNGVLHAAADNFRIKIRNPVPIYWEPTDQPELRRMTDIFRVPGKSVNFSPGVFKNIEWPNSVITYVTTATENNVYNDYFMLNIRPNGFPWIEFTSPLIVKGRYKVWVCYRRVNTNDFQLSFNGEPLPRLFGLNPTPGYPSGVTIEEAESQGWKQYTDPKNSNWVGRLVGTIDVKTTDVHKFRITALTNRGGSTGNNFRLDQIHIIPADAPQITPRFRVDGTPVFTP